jgi:transposase
MAMGTRKHRERQEELWYRSELPEAPGHPFYRRLNEVLEREGFDRFCEGRCREFYHEKLGRPSLAPGLYFRLMMIGFFEGLDSERGIGWRVADSLTLRQFLQIGLDERTPDHVTISRTRRLISGAAHQQVFGWVLKRLARGGLMRGKTIGIDSTTLEANAAMQSIVRRNTQESYTEYLKRLAQADGVEAEDPAALRRMDRKRAKKMRNEEWVNPHDSEAEITRLKDGRTALAYKVEQAVDMESGAIVAITTHSGAVGDTESIGETLPQAAEAVASQIAETTTEGKYPVNFAGVEEVVADKGYHSNEVVRDLAELGVRTYIAEPERGARKWNGRRAEQAAVYANRRRIQGARGKRLQAGRGERVERNFAHQFDTGGMDRLYVRGLHNVHKKLLIQAAACNLALLMRTLYGAGKPKAAHDRRGELILVILRLHSVLTALCGLEFRIPAQSRTNNAPSVLPLIMKVRAPQKRWFRHGLLDHFIKWNRCDPDRAILPVIQKTIDATRRLDEVHERWIQARRPGD